MTLDAEGARAAADAADAALAAGDDVGPLHGLPVAHKDTHATGGMRTTWGSPLHTDTVPLRDELIVARYKAAGAVRVGKTNVPEFAAGSHTFNPVFGASHNPYRHGLSVGGSSGGGGGGAGGGFRAAGRRQRHGRLAAQPGRLLQRRRLPAHAGPGADLAGGPGLVAAVGAGADGPHRRRRRAAAVGGRRGRPAGADLAVRRPGGVRRAAARPRWPVCGWRGRRTSAAG